MKENKNQNREQTYELGTENILDSNETALGGGEKVHDYEEAKRQRNKRSEIHSGKREITKDY